MRSNNGTRLRKKKKTGRRNVLSQVVESSLIHKVSTSEYRRRVRNVYKGPRGALLATASMLSLHVPLGERLLRRRIFDLRGAKCILDVGSGAGQITKHLLKYADPDARIIGIDLSVDMLRRARQRLRSNVPTFIAGDLASLPFADESFDCITCGYVLEHLSDPSGGLAELSRVMKPGGRMLLSTSEDNLGGAWTSRIWKCRTYNRAELQEISRQQRLFWKQELWYSRVHKAFRAGGICVEIEKVAG